MRHTIWPWFDCDSYIDIKSERIMWNVLRYKTIAHCICRNKTYHDKLYPFNFHKTYCTHTYPVGGKEGVCRVENDLLLFSVSSQDRREYNVRSVLTVPAELSRRPVQKWNPPHIIYPRCVRACTQHLYMWVTHTRGRHERRTRPRVYVSVLVIGRCHGHSHAHTYSPVCASVRAFICTLGVRIFALRERGHKCICSIS